MKNQILSFESLTSLYHKHCSGKGIIPQQPSQMQEGRKYLTLHNGYGIIARFNIKEKIFV